MLEFEYLEVEYIARRRLLANLAFSKCSTSSTVRIYFQMVVLELRAKWGHVKANGIVNVQKAPSDKIECLALNYIWFI